MGKFQKGILGGFSGKVGTVVGANWRGIDVMRSLPKKSQRAATEAQLAQRVKFTEVAKFLGPIRPVVRLYFGQAAGEKSRSNLATSYHLQEAILGAYPNFSIEYAKVLTTKGDLLGADTPTAAVQNRGEVLFSWSDNTGEGQALATDQVLVVVYNESKKAFEYKQTATRSSSSYTMPLPANWSGDTVHCWLSLIAADDSKYSSSRYLNSVVVL